MYEERFRDNKSPTPERERSRNDLVYRSPDKTKFVKKARIMRGSLRVLQQGGRTRRR